ncbi:ribonuclease H-like domain-containing protein [Aspergillus pseudoustus]|uniref:ribonuclease H n=1 Tax=Aspergillus pseudoustus TaxID=1810923 RepID=A0ABR4IVP0_9EURO
MVYTMEVYVDGCCRGNGQPDAIGAAAAAFKQRNGSQKCWYRRLPAHPTPTNQRAELTNIILGLEKALEIWNELLTNPSLNVTIHSDSRYAIASLTEWIYNWENDNWLNAQENPVANQDLIQEAAGLGYRLKQCGCVAYVWIPREQNTVADGTCNRCLGNAEEPLIR